LTLITKVRSEKGKGWQTKFRSEERDAPGQNVSVKVRWGAEGGQREATRRLARARPAGDEARVEERADNNDEGDCNERFNARPTRGHSG
jgi:hypothetical protein